jgi:hypothetical protein
MEILGHPKNPHKRPFQAGSSLFGSWRTIVALLLSGPPLVCQSYVQPSRLVEPIDDRPRVELPGSTPLQAQPQYDKGR